jgi:hypothetical protein
MQPNNRRSKRQTKMVGQVMTSGELAQSAQANQPGASAEGLD